MSPENTSDTTAHSQNIQRMLTEVIGHARQDIDKVKDPRFEALLETTAEVLIGVRTAFEHFTAKSEQVWRSR